MTDTPKPSSLYHIADELERAIANSIDPDTGEVIGSWEAIDKLDMSVRDKALSVAAYIKGLRVEADATAAIGDAIKAQAHSHYHRAASLRGKAVSLMRYLERNLQLAGIAGESISDARAVISYRKSPGRAEVIEPDRVPASLCFDPKPLLPSKDKIKAAMKERAVSELRDADGEVFAVLDAPVVMKVD